MSKLDELIQELCPNGVEYKKLGELGKFYGGLTGKSREDFIEGNAKFITYRNVYSNPALQIDVEDRVNIAEGEKQRTLQYGDVIFTGSSETPDECGFSSVVTVKTDEKLYLNSFCFFFRFDDMSVILPNFAKHLFRSNELRYQIGKTASGVTRYNVSKKLMEKVVIPIPPLPVQSEIARILDNFTELTAELTAELTVRKKQYEYYRDYLLLSNENKAEMMCLEEICYSISSGKAITKNNVGKFPVYGSTGIIAKTDNAVYNKSCILVARVGANAGYTHLADGSYDVSDNTLIIDVKDEFNIKYIYYQLVNAKLNRYAKGGGQPLVTAGQIKKVTIPIVPLNIQKRIVDVLDNFEKICSDLNIGLPAEIEARQKQYEYYRDLLLTFAENGHIIDQTDRQTDRQSIIRLLQYVFGYAPVKVKDVFTRIKGTPITASTMKKIEDKNGDVTIYAGGKTIVKAKENDIPNANITRVPSVLVQSRGIIDVIYIDKPFTFKNEMWAYTCSNEVTLKYLYYVLKSNIKKLRDAASGMGSMPQIALPVTEDLVVNLPTIEEQKHVVSVLDKFDSLCNNLGSGIPAEIEYRSKQYEYYRDKLLDFKRFGD